MEPLRPSARACDGMILAFAAWTSCAHAVVFSGAGLTALLFLFAVVAAAGIALAALRRSRSSEASVPVVTAESVRPRGAPLALLGAGGITIAYVVGASPVALWWAAVAYFLVAAFVVLRAPLEECEAPAPGGERLVWTLALLGALLPLFVDRYSPDDAYYVNVAVRVADAPRAPLLAEDSLHGVPGLPLMYSVYRINSFEVLGGALARLTPLTAIQVMHWVLPAVFGAFLVLAYARLCRAFAPAHWKPVWLACLAYLVFVADRAQSFGSFAFTRLHQGKAVFLCVAVPLVIVYGLRFARSPSPRGWLLLFAAHVASLGMTATALWVSPVVGALALASGASWSKRGLRDVALGVAASGYSVLLGLGFRGASMAETEDYRWDEFDGRLEFFAEAWKRVLGEGAVSVVFLFAGLVAWTLCGSAAARRACVVFPLGFLLVFFDPYTVERIATGITGPGTYWRVFWVLPLPLFGALLLAAPARLARARPRLALVASTGLVTAFLLFAPTQYPGRWYSTKPFRTKAPEEKLHVAERLAAAVDSDALVLAPSGIAPFVGMVHGHPGLLVARKHYLELQRDHLGDDDADLRDELYRFLSGDLVPDDPGALLDRGIERFDLAAVVVRPGARQGAVLTRLLRRRGFRSLERVADWEIWTR